MKTLRLKEVCFEFLTDSDKFDINVWSGLTAPDIRQLLTIDQCGDIRLGGFLIQAIDQSLRFWIEDTTPDPLELLEELHKNLDGLDPDENWCISYTDNGYFVFMVWFADGEPQYNGDDETYFELYADAINHAYAIAKELYPELEWRH